MNSLSDKLRREIENWTEKLDKKIGKVVSSDKKGSNLLENAESYKLDSRHFLQEKT